MKAGPGVAALYEALDLLQRASLLLEGQGERVLVAHIGMPIEILEEKLKRTVQ